MDPITGYEKSHQYAGRKKERTEKTSLFGVNLKNRQVIHWAAQEASHTILCISACWRPVAEFESICQMPSK